jgi:hypothetical protein
MNEEQLYYKEKYFKYKLKYQTLKKQHIDGGGFSLSSSTAVKTPVNTKTTITTTAQVVAEKTTSDFTSDVILSRLYELLDSGNKETETLIHRVNGQRSDAIDTNNYKIKKLMGAEMDNPTTNITIYNLSNLDHIEKMLHKVLYLAKLIPSLKNYIPDVEKLKKYLKDKLKKEFF